MSTRSCRTADKAALYYGNLRRSKLLRKIVIRCVLGFIVSVLFAAWCLR